MATQKMRGSSLKTGRRGMASAGRKSAKATGRPGTRFAESTTRGASSSGRPGQRSAAGMTKKARMAEGGLTNRVQGRASARGKRAQAGRDSRQRGSKATGIW